jgi:putative transposase
VWERNWERIIPFFEFPQEIRKIIYTTNAVESLHMSLRKVTKNRGSFPTRDAALKLIYLAIKNASRNWEFVQTWCDALRQFTIRWPERIERAQAT